jgi:hypothetical protein
MGKVKVGFAVQLDVLLRRGSGSDDEQRGIARLLGFEQQIGNGRSKASRLVGVKY